MPKDYMSIIVDKIAHPALYDGFLCAQPYTDVYYKFHEKNFKKKINFPIGQKENFNLQVIQKSTQVCSLG